MPSVTMQQCCPSPHLYDERSLKLCSCLLEYSQAPALECKLQEKRSLFYFVFPILSSLSGIQWALHKNFFNSFKCKKSSLFRAIPRGNITMHIRIASQVAPYFLHSIPQKAKTTTKLSNTHRRPRLQKISSYQL